MSVDRFDVVVAKKFSARRDDGLFEERTVWNRVGVAWSARSQDSLNFELFLIPGQRYVINLKRREESVGGPALQETQNQKTEE